MKIKKGDNVIVLAGKDKGKKGKVISANPTTQRVVVEGVQKVKKHLKPRTRNEKGSMSERESSLHVSNVAIIDPKSNKQTRVGKKLVSGKMVRVAQKSNQELA